jgi:hypothetical protein
MHTARRHARISETRDLLAKLRPSGHPAHRGRVLNLSEGGMLVVGGRLKVGQKTGFELSGPNFHYAGVAEVAHLTNGTTGLRFLSWQGHADRPIRSMIEHRSEWKPPKGQADADQRLIRRVAVLVGPKRPPGPSSPAP